MKKKTKAVGKRSKKGIRAWAFLADSNDLKNKYFVKELGNEFNSQTIYLKKPPALPHPFSRGHKWKPSELLIIVPSIRITRNSKKKANKRI